MGDEIARTAVRTATQREAWLIARVLARDLRAFEELFQAYRPRLTRFLSNLIQRPALIEEVFNDTMMVVWTDLEKFKGSSKLSTWIFGIAYRKAMKAVRRFDEPVEDMLAENRISADTDPEQSSDQQRIIVTIRSAIDRLSPPHRAVVDLTYFHDMGYREIAEIMACPVDTVKTRMFHARRQIRKMLPGNVADWV